MNAKLSEVFRKLFSVTELADNLSPENVQGWDSFSHIELIMELEKTFALSITASEAVELNSVAKISAYLRDKDVS